MMTKNGRWQANDCANEYRTACRSALDPNVWIITKNAHTYDRSLSACPNNFIFDVPRVPRQNSLLFDEILAANVTEEKIWINLNLVNNANACWAIDRYGTCWWADEVSFCSKKKKNQRFNTLIQLFFSIMQSILA
jgi:hypothetical protein